MVFVAFFLFVLIDIIWCSNISADAISWIQLPHLDPHSRGVKFHFAMHIANATKRQQPAYIKLNGFKAKVDTLETLFTPYSNVAFRDYCHEWGKSSRYQCMLNNSDINVTSRNALNEQNVDYKLQLLDAAQIVIAESLPMLNGKQMSIKVMDINDECMHILIQNPITDPAYYRLMYKKNETDGDWTMIADWNRLKRLTYFPANVRLNFTHHFELPQSGKLLVTTHTESSSIWNITKHEECSDKAKAGNPSCCPAQNDHIIDISHAAHDDHHHSFDVHILC